MKNKVKSLNRKIKRGHVKVIPRIVTENVITRWETNPILGGVEPVWEDKTTIVPEFFQRTKRGHFVKMM